MIRHSKPNAPSSKTGIGRRGFLTAATTTLAGLALAPATAKAQDASAVNPMPKPPAPVVDARFPVEIAPGVFLISDNRVFLVPNIGIIVGDDAVLVVDCGLGLESAEAVLQTARELAPGRDVILTVTHAHPEHGASAQVFKSAGRVYYNKMQHDYQDRLGNTLLEVFRQGFLPPEHAYVLDGITLDAPTATYDGDTSTIDLGGRIVELRTWGVAHSPGDQIVHVPDAGVVFAGDLIEERMFPIVPYFPTTFGADDIDIAGWNTALAYIQTLNPNVIVPGHGALGGNEIATAITGYFTSVERLLADAGGVQDGLNVIIRDAYPTWENAFFIDPAIAYFARNA